MAVVLAVLAGGGWLAALQVRQSQDRGSGIGPEPAAHQEPMSLKERRKQTASGNTEGQMGAVEPPAVKGQAAGAAPAGSPSRQSAKVQAGAGDEIGNPSRRHGYDSAGNIISWNETINSPIRPQSNSGAVVPGETITVAVDIDWLYASGGASSGARTAKITWGMNPCSTVSFGDIGTEYDFKQVLTVYGSSDQKPVRVAAKFVVPDVRCQGNPNLRLYVTPVIEIEGSTRAPERTVQFLRSVGFQVVPSRPGTSVRGGCNDVSGSPRTEGLRADPVNTATGAFSECFTDVTVPGSGIPFSAKRTYSSDIDTAGYLGKGWVLPWESRLEIKSGGDVVLHAEGGSQHPYTKTGNSFTAPGWARSKLAVDGSGYRLTTPDQRSLGYDSAGRLTSIKDRSDQGLTVVYTGTQPTAIKDAAGRTAILSYTGPLLSRITLEDGRHVDYSYTGSLLTGVTALDGGVEAYGYDASGRLDKVTDALGRTRVVNVYGADGRMASQTDALGKVTQFKYTEAGAYKQTDTITPDGAVWTDLYGGNVLVKQLDPFGNLTRYGYDSNFNRINTFDAEGRFRSWSYDTAGRMTESAGLESSESWSYDSAGNISRRTDGTYNTTAFGYDARNRLTSVKDPLGNTQTYTYTPAGLRETATSARGKATRYTYGAAGNMESVTTATGGKSTYTYYPSGQVKTVIEARGNTAGADPAKYTTTFTYDPADRVQSVTDARGNKTAYEYDLAGNLKKVTDAKARVTFYEYDNAGRPIRVTDPAGKTTATEYDAMGQVTSVTDRTGAKTTYAYDKASRQIEMVTARGNATGATKADYTWKYGYDKVGNRKTVTDPKGKTTAFTWNADNRPLTTTNPLGLTRKVEYDGSGRVLRTYDGLGYGTTLAYDSAGRLATSTTAYRAATTYGYDADGNLTSTLSPQGERTTYGYDDDSRRSSMVDPRGNTAGADPAKYTWSYGYDLAGRPTSVTDPLGQSSTTGYDPVGNIAFAKDARGQQTLFGYDELNRQTEVTNPDGGATLTGYNTAGQLETITNANKHVTTYGYDAEGRVTSVKNPLGKTVSYGYDAEGHRTQVTNARGQKITTTIDALSLPTQVTYSDGTPTVTYTYDDASRISTVTDATGTRTAAYDKANRVTSITSPGAANPFTYSWYNDATLKSRSYPDGRRTDYTYDNNNRITEQIVDGKKTSYGYDPAGNPTSVTLPTTTARSETRTYDQAGRLATLTTPAGARAFGYDENNRLTSDTPTTGTPTRYSYDNTGRLARTCTDTSATSCLTGTDGTSYAYDPVGNLATTKSPASTTTRTYDAADRLTAATTGTTTTPFAYDEDGNQTGDGNETYTYDPVGRIKTAKIAADTYAFGYDSDGNRTTTSKNGTLASTSRWDINNPLPQLATDTSAAGTLLADYQYDPDGTARSMNRTAGTYYFTQDRQKSVSTVYDAAGTDNYRYTYDPWGQSTGTSTITGGQSSPFGYTGQYKDQTLPDRLQLRARSYDPTQGRFTSTDPVPAPIGSPNSSAYNYANNDPLNLSDPSGACPMCIGAGIGAAFGAGIYTLTHQGDFNWRDFAVATGTGAAIGAGAAFLAPAGATVATSLGLTGGRAFAGEALTNAGVGAAYTWAVNTAQCLPTTPGDLLLGAAAGSGGSLIGAGWQKLRGLLQPSAQVHTMVGYTYNMVTNPGPLAQMRNNPAANFRSGQYNAYTLPEDTIFYRGGDSSGSHLGQWFTRNPPAGEMEVRVDSAVKHIWQDGAGRITGTSVIDAVYTVKIPAGTTVYGGPVATQGGMYSGGGYQYFIPEPWLIDGVEFVAKAQLR
ncbi:DUF6531 domain-containing protein [Streptomyces sp. NPDC054956]